MLQQTRVETVRERWSAFLDRFPDLSHLAAADEADVLKAWEGLGYYRRARNLRRAAEAIDREWGGRLPTRVEELSSLPGFGPYTAAAVASIAFGRQAAVVDGNVLRVLARYLHEAGDVTRQPARRRIEDAARHLVPRARPGDWNQALMELGATVCVPRKPRCSECPLARDCEARLRGRTAHVPKKRAAKRTPHHDVAAGFVRRGGRLLVRRRPPEGLLGGLWELPSTDRADAESLEDACVRGIHETTGLDVGLGELLGTLEHAYSHFRITLHVFAGEAAGGRARARAGAAARFAGRADLERYAFARVHRLAIERFLDA